MEAAESATAIQRNQVSIPIKFLPFSIPFVWFLKQLEKFSGKSKESGN